MSHLGSCLAIGTVLEDKAIGAMRSFVAGFRIGRDPAFKGLPFQEHESAAIIEGPGEASLAFAFASGTIDCADVKERRGLNSDSLFVFTASPRQVQSQNRNKPLGGDPGEKQE